MRTIRVIASGLIALTLAACGSEDEGAADATVLTSSATETTASSGPTTTESGVEPLLLYNGILQAGTYVGNQFEQPITLTVGEGWEAYEGFRNVDLYEVVPDGSAGGSFAILDHAADLTIDEVIAEFESVDAVSFSAPEPTTLAGLDGVKLTAEPSAEITPYYFLGNGQEWWGTPAGLRSEFHIVEAPTGTRVVAIEALPEQWESFRALAQSVIDTISWTE